VIYVEGGVSNGTGLMQFKKGAFHSLRPVTPMVMKFEFGCVNPAFTLDILPLIILNLSLISYQHCEVNLMPAIYPNEYLFETHKDKGSEKWEIYAWAVRDAMLKCGKFENK